jgi:beta-N-acetylhexosaminidase
MKLTDEHKFDVDKTLGSYLSKAKRSNKKEMVLRQILTHQAGLKAWIPFWQNTLVLQTQTQAKILDPKVFQAKKSKRFPFQVADNLYIQKKYFKKNITKQIWESPVTEKKDYIYSDLSYYLYPEVIKKLTKKNVVDFLDQSFYKPLGTSTLTYNPLQKFPKERIIPTEYDSLFRKQLIHGYVHDEGAAMLGGVSTHAGLFGTSNDLAKLLQMYLQKGYYGGIQYLSPEVLAEFTHCQFCPTNLRGIGFDRQRGTNAAKSVSEQSYGHSGFTGNLVWIDPANGLLYIFLSNRVYPTRNNSRISDLNIRTDIQEVFYEALRR